MGDSTPDADAVERRLNDSADERERRERERVEERAAKAEERKREKEERAAAKANQSNQSDGRGGRGGGGGSGSRKEFEQIGIGLLAGAGLLWFLNKSNSRPGMSDRVLENPEVADLQGAEQHQIPERERSVDYTKPQEKPAIAPGPPAPSFSYWSQPATMYKVART